MSSFKNRKKNKKQSNRGNAPDTKGTAFVVYEDIYDAKRAVDHLYGFNVCGRYLVVLYYQQNKMLRKVELEKKKKELEAIRAKFGLDGPSNHHIMRDAEDEALERGD